MIERLFQYKNGFVRIRLQSPNPERFLNLCALQQIVLSKVCQKEEGLEMQISVKDFFRLKTVCRKTSSRIHVVKRWGLPFFFYRNKKRKAFFIGIFLCFGLILFLSQYVWSIRVEGNYYNTTQEILKFLETENVYHGIAKRKINCSSIASMIREEFQDITWVSAKLSGTNLSITVQENENLNAAVPGQEKEPSSIVADIDGTIVKMITRQGVPQTEPGKHCKKGDLLVLGRLEIKNDSQEVVRYEYVPSDADIYVKHTYSYYDQFPMTYQKRSYTGRQKSHSFLQILSWRIEGTLFRKKYEKEDTVTREKKLSLTENFILPVSYGTITQQEFTIKKITYTKEEARRKARENLTLYLEKLMEQEIEICKNNVEIQVDETNCTAMGTIEVIEKAGKQVPVERLEDPKERKE